MKLVGLDISGWHDVSARDWDIDGSDAGLNNIKHIDGGVGSVAVLNSSGKWLGGPQAVLAPHGLGQGWGELGGSDRRIPITNCYSALISGKETIQDAFTAAIESLTRHADEAILNIADTKECDEGARTRIIIAARGGLRRVRLLWRPVALCLEALRTGVIGAFDVGHCYGFIIHSDDGFEFQRLRLREDTEHAGHYAPEREGYGLSLKSKLGLSSISQSVLKDIVDANPVLNENRFSRIELAPGFMTGRIAPGSKHVVRHDNRSWIEIKAPMRLSLIADGEFPDLIASAIRQLGPVDKLFLVSPLSDELVETLKASLVPLKIECARLPWSGLAAGSLYAGRIVEKGLPHYFDRLTPISLAVIKGDEPKLEDLVDRSHTHRADKEYEPPPYRDLKWPRGIKELEFNVIKADEEVRRWTVVIDSPPLEDMPVELIFRQTPGQSWAKLHLTSNRWDELQRNPIALDWEVLHPSDETPQDVLNRLQKPPPTIPMRIIEPPTMELWTGSPNFVGLLEVVQSDSFNAKKFAELLTRSVRVQVNEDERTIRMWTIGTDGAFPSELSSQNIDTFNRIVNSLEANLLSAIKSKMPLQNNNEIRALTWTFVRCSEEIQGAIIDALEADLNVRAHPLLTPRQSRTVLLQGAGRAVSGRDRIRRVLKVLTTVEPFHPTRTANNNTFSALAMLLARRKDAPQALDEKLVERIITILSFELTRLLQSKSTAGFQVRFKNALLALAGLFRYREIEPYALLRGNDQISTQLWEDLKMIRDRLIANLTSIPMAQTKIELVGELMKYLEGRGDANVLIRIDASDEVDDNEQF